ncbi:MAG: zinc-binding alcohol dehydrogenase family protein [Bacteriovoracaceae bacterium]|nr:zinc-binding alcohol dehydrogenase family protein [Bacteriovoracaceae bacterium]
MRCIALENGRFYDRIVDDPKINEFQNVKIQIKAISFNPIDAQIKRGMSESKLAASSILGRECAGIITETSAEVKNFKVGDKVCVYVSNMGSNGTFAEFVTVPSKIICKISGDISLEQAATLPLSCTALQAVERAKIRPEHSIFLAGGAGGVGSVLVSLLKLYPHAKLSTTFGSSESRERLLRLGLEEDQIFDYRTPDQDLMKKLLDFNGGHAFDIVFDTVGNNLSKICAEILQPFGKYLDITAFTTAEAREVLFDKAAEIHCIANYAYGYWRESASFYSNIGKYAEMMAELFALINDGKLPPPEVEIVGGFSSETVSLALERLEQNKSFGKKLVMSV